jgi:hypothetical protein
MVDPSTLGGVSRGIKTPERSAMRAGMETEERWPEAPRLIDNITGRVFSAVKDAGIAPLTSEELADAQKTLDGVTGASALNAYPELQTAEGLAGVRRQLNALADMGADQRFWYDDSSRAIMDAVQGNKTDGEKIAQLVAIYSNNTPVGDNMNNAMTAWTQFKLGAAIDAPTLSENNRRATELLYGGQDWKAPDQQLLSQSDEEHRQRQVRRDGRGVGRDGRDHRRVDDARAQLDAEVAQPEGRSVRVRR